MCKSGLLAMRMLQKQVKVNIPVQTFQTFSYVKLCWNFEILSLDFEFSDPLEYVLGGRSEVSRPMYM